LWVLSTTTGNREYVCYGDTGGSGGAINKQTAFRDLDGFGNALPLTDSNNDGFVIHTDSDGPVMSCIIGYGTTNTPCTPREIKTFNIPPGKWFVDGTYFVHQTNATINANGVRDALLTGDSDSGIMRTFMGIPDRWDGVKMKIYSFVHTKEGTPNGDIQIDWTGYCVEDNGANGGASWPSATGNGVMTIDLDGKATHDLIITGTVGNIPLSGCTSANKKGLWLRGVVNSTGTTADDSGVNPALADQIFIDFQVEYGLKANTD
jgi:hypothetical protein